MSPIASRLKLHLDLSLRMLMNEIEACPDDLWAAKAGGFPFFQQVLHALTGLHYWARPEGLGFEEPFAERKLYLELDGVPEGAASKEELRAYGASVARQAESFFEGKDDEWLFSPCHINPKINNFDVVQGQIRHLQYHAGHCDAVLRERGLAAPDWLEYFGE